MLRRWALILLIICVAAGGLYCLIGSERNGEKNTIKRIFTALEEPSPYSLRWGTLLACVVDRQGDPVVNAKVTFKAKLTKNCDGETTEQAPDWHETVVLTDEDGAFAILPEVWAGDEEKKERLDACIEATGFLKRTVEIGVNYASDNDGKIDILRAGQIAGVLIDPDGNPIANAPVRLDTTLAYQNPSSSCHGCFSDNVKTDENGAFAFEKVPAGYHVVKFPGFGGCGTEAETVIPFKEYAACQMLQMADGQIKPDVFLDLRQSHARLTGRVVDQYDHPMAAVNVHVYREIVIYHEEGHTTTRPHIKSALTDDSGVYVLDHLPAGDYKLNAAYPYKKDRNYKSGESVDVYLSGDQELPFELVLERQE